MSLPPAEERKLQHRKIDQLGYIAFLLEHLAHNAAPGRMEFTEFQQHLRKTHASQLQQGQTSLQPERENGNGSRETPETGGSDSILGQAAGKAAQIPKRLYDQWKMTL